MTTKLKSLVIVSVLVVALTTGGFVRADVTYSGGDTVDVNDVVQGYLWIEDATVNLLEGAYIKNVAGGSLGDIYATSGSVLNIYGGEIDNYLYVTTAYNDFPEAVVTVYGYGFAVDGNDITQGTPEVFLENNQLSGVYQSGMAFSHWVSCFWEGDFYLTVKLGWITSKPEMSVSPLSLDFGQVKVGQRATQIVTVANTGNANLSLQSVSMAGDSNPGFSTPLTQLPVTVEPNDSVSVEVIFSPTAAGEAEGVLQITSDDPNMDPNIPVEVVLTGVGTIPDIAVEPVSLDFGQLDIGTSSAPQSMTIHNYGDAQLIVESIAWAGGVGGDFAVAVLPELPLVIEPNRVIELQIVYTPTTEGAAAATLKIGSDDLDQPMVNLAVTGIGVYPPLRQINDIIAFYDQSVQNGTIQGVGPGKLAQAHIKVIKEALLITKCLIQSKYQRLAIAVLMEIDKFTDGKPKPSDIITGSVVAELNARIETLITTLKTE